MYKKSRMKALFFCVFFAAVLCSCKEKPVKNPEPVDIFDSTPESENLEIQNLSWHHSQKKICIVFGYGYNEKNYVQRIVAQLSKKYGQDDGTPDSGLIFPLIFPDDFPMNRISRLPALIDERELAGLIVIGAPENTNYALANLEDEWASPEKMIPYPVYAFFPQDDVAGIEATSNFVVDFALEGNGRVDSEETNREEVVQTQLEDLEKILDNAIEYMLLTGEPLPPDSDLIIHVKRIFGKNYSVSRYVDAESGLQSINHFVIEDAKK